MGYISREMNYSQIPSEVFDFQAGQFTCTPIVVDDGFQLIYVADRIEAEQLSFDEVKDEIVAQLQYYVELEKYDALLARLREKAEIIYSEANTQ